MTTILSLDIVPAVYAQAITGRIVGTVQDRNQSAVPNAKVTITNQGTGISSEFQTDSQGNYIAPSLPSGAYKVTIAAQGFRQAVANNIEVNVAQTTRLDLTLEVGNVQEAVEITGGAALVQSTTSDLGEIVNQRQVQTLPLNGRIFSQLIQLVPGAVPAGFGAAPEAASTAGARTFTSASVNGLPWAGTTYYLDGIENKETLNAFISMSPPIEAIEEFKVQTNSASAEYGAFGGGVVNLTLRSGTNEYHGALFEYMRNEALNARDFFAASKNPFKTHQFGGVFGGPIVKNKAFFFGDYQGLRLRGGRPFTASVPTQAMREGRFLASEGFANPIFDPASSADPAARAQFASFAWGKSIDNGSGIRTSDGDSLTPSNDYNLELERGLSAFDFRRRWTSSWVWELPVGKGKRWLGDNRVGDFVLGGWQMGGILTLQDGFPFTVTCGPGNIQNGGGICYPDSTGGNPNLPRDQQTRTRFFNTDAYVDRIPSGGPFRFGATARNSVIGPGIISFDASANKKFNLTESKYLEFRTEIFNLPNHPIWSPPGTQLRTPNFGVINSTKIDSRQIQFALKLVV